MCINVTLTVSKAFADVKGLQMCNSMCSQPTFQEVLGFKAAGDIEEKEIWLIEEHYLRLSDARLRERALLCLAFKIIPCLLEFPANGCRHLWGGVPQLELACEHYIVPAANAWCC